ncbi:MAG: TetR/AcrR family transcriptional regulator [Solirubrobacteraceae bacterium]|nr:TetR/AcrR family transcriptional regulator [Solirubrobacteraceae bacterium]
MSSSPPQPLPPGRSGIPREEVEASQRGRLLDAMEQLCFESGYSAVRIADLAARSRTAKRTFYAHFADREDCFLAAYDRIDADVFAALARGAAKASDPLGRIELALTEMCRMFAGAPPRAEVYVLSSLAVGARVTARRAQSLEDLAALYIALHEVVGEAFVPRTPLSRLRALSVVGAVELPLVTTLREEGAAALPAIAPGLARTAYSLVYEEASPA